MEAGDKEELDTPEREDSAVLAVLVETKSGSTSPELIAKEAGGREGDLPRKTVGIEVIRCCGLTTATKRMMMMIIVGNAGRRRSALATIVIRF